MNTKLFSLRSLALAVLLCAASAVRADITVYTDRASFLAALTGSVVDTFDDVPLGHIDGPLVRSVGPYGYIGTTFQGLWSIGSASDRWLTNSRVEFPIIFDTFTGGANAVGGNFFGTDIDGNVLPNATLQLLAQDANGYVVYDLPHPGQDSFIGFISTDPLTIIGVLDEVPGEFATVNNLTLGMAAPVPEPATPAMLLAGLSALGLAVKRRSVG